MFNKKIANVFLHTSIDWYNHLVHPCLYMIKKYGIRNILQANILSYYLVSF